MRLLNLPPSKNQIKYFNTFITNLLEGIEYYKQLFSFTIGRIFDIKKKADYEITTLEEKLHYLITDMANKNLINKISSSAYMNSAI